MRKSVTIFIQTSMNVLAMGADSCFLGQILML